MLVRGGDQPGSLGYNRLCKVSMRIGGLERTGGESRLASGWARCAIEAWANTMTSERAARSSAASCTRASCRSVSPFCRAAKACCTKTASTAASRPRALGVVSHQLGTRFHGAWRRAKYANPRSELHRLLSHRVVDLEDRHGEKRTSEVDERRRGGAREHDELSPALDSETDEGDQAPGNSGQRSLTHQILEQALIEQVKHIHASE